MMTWRKDMHGIFKERSNWLSMGLKLWVCLNRQHPQKSGTTLKYCISNWREIAFGSRSHFEIGKTCVQKDMVFELFPLTILTWVECLFDLE